MDREGKIQVEYRKNKNGGRERRLIKEKIRKKKEKRLNRKWEGECKENMNG